MDSTEKTDTDKLLGAALGHPGGIVHGPPDPVMQAKPPDTEAIAQAKASARALLEQAKALVVENEADCKIGGGIIARCASATRALDGLFRPNIKRLDKAHKDAVAELKTMTVPLAEARAIADRTMGDWRAEQRAWEDRQAADVQARLLADAREKRDAEIKLLDDAGRTEEAVARIDAPLPPIPPVNIHSAIPEIAGQSIRVTWKAKVVNAALVPRDWCIPDQRRLDGHARDTKGAIPVAGVEFIPIESTAQRST